VNWVIDANVLIKFFIPEVLSDKAAELLKAADSGGILLCAPDLVYSETGNILWKKYRMKELSQSEVEEIFEAILELPLKITASKSLSPLAVGIGMRYGITVYDAMYITLASVTETTLVTADKRLHDRLSKTDLSKSLMWLGDFGHSF
jgi:predicted nucleic acid-binding protein